MKSKEQKRIEAEVRQEEYATLSPLDRLYVLDTRTGESTKERAKILAKLTAYSK